MVTIYQGMRSNLGDLPSIPSFYVFPVKMKIFIINTYISYQIRVGIQEENVCMFPYSGKPGRTTGTPKQKTSFSPTRLKMVMYLKLLITTSFDRGSCS